MNKLACLIAALCLNTAIAQTTGIDIVVENTPVSSGWVGDCSNTANITKIIVRKSATCSGVFTLPAVNQPTSTPTSTPAPVITGYVVSNTGSDLVGTGTVSSPWKTIGYALTKMVGGDTLIIKDGVYAGKENFIISPKGGTASKQTVIKAETPFGVRIQSSSAVGYNDNQLLLSANYVTVDGIIFDMSGSYYPEYQANVPGSFNKVTRSIFKRGGSIDNYGGLFYMTGNDNLVEDVAGVGVCRYCFAQGGPSSSTQRNIWRRVVGRMDYSNSNQPKATFASYGNDGNGSMKDHLYQNVIAIDGNNPVIGTGELKYGGIYTPKTATNVKVYGSIVLNEAVAHTGMFLREFNSVNSVYNSVVWDLKESTYAAGIKANSADRITVGGNIPGSATDLINTPTNSLLKPASIPATIVDNAVGASVLKRYGVSGTRWGEPGFDQATNENLWPWPYQDKIKAVFAEANIPPAGNKPTVNNTKRGFAADGNGLYGGPITLTSYIWEYTGTMCPTSICPK